jgi:hypothetical protein
MRWVVSAENSSHSLGFLVGFFHSDRQFGRTSPDKNQKM